MPPRPSQLISVIHYHQPAKTQPRYMAVEEGVELVELVTSGRGWVRDEGQWVEVTPGTLIWHVAGDVTIGRSDVDDPYRCLAVSMESRAGALRRAPHLSYVDDLARAVAFTTESVRLFLDAEFPRETLFDYIYGTLVHWAQLCGHRRERAGICEPLRVARSMVELRYMEPIRVADLAKAAGWSLPHFHDQFRAVFGATPRQAILERRLRAARELLLSSGLSIKQIAADTGFTHSSAFCSAFRSAFEQTPKSFREAYAYGLGR